MRTAAHAVRARLTDIDWGQRRYETARDIIASADMLIARLRKETE